MPLGERRHYKEKEKVENQTIEILLRKAIDVQQMVFGAVPELVLVFLEPQIPLAKR